MFTGIEWYRSLEGLGRRPAVDGCDVYVVVFDQYTREYQLKAFNRGDGQLQWVSRAPSGGYASLAVDSEHVYMPSSFTQLTAVRRRDGGTAWSYDFRSRLRSTPTLWNGRLLVGTANRYIELDAATGRVAREQILHGQFLFGQVSPVGDTCYLLACQNLDGAGSQLAVVALNLHDLSVKWCTPIGSGLVASSDTAGVVVEGDRLFCGGVDGNIYALCIGDGTIVWTASTGSVAFRSAPAYADGRVFIGNMAGDLCAYDAAQGDLLWKQHLTDEGLWCSPFATGQWVLAHAGNDFYVVEAATGRILSCRAIGHAPYTGIEAHGDEIYICGGDPPDYAALLKLRLTDSLKSVLRNGAVKFEPLPDPRYITISFGLNLADGATASAVLVDMRPLGGSQRELVTCDAGGHYSFSRRVPVAKLLGQGAIVVTVETTQGARFETIGFNLTSTKPIPQRHLIDNIVVAPQDRVDYSGPYVVQGIMGRLGKDTDLDEVYDKGNYIVSRGLDPHHKWRSGSVRIFHSRSGAFAEATNEEVTPDKLFE